MLAVAPFSVCPGTLRNVDVAVDIEVFDQSPEIDLSTWDNAVEASISIPSGKLIVMGCTGYLPDAPPIEVQLGTYQLLSLAGGIETIQNEWEPAEDLYRVYLWPGPEREPYLLKQWQHAIRAA
jgi:hypothetical protein